MESSFHGAAIAYMNQQESAPLRQTRISIMQKLIAILALGGLLASPAIAGEIKKPRLVAGGMNLSQSAEQAELFNSGDFSAGAIADAPLSSDKAPDRMVMGGYAAYAFRDLQISSSLKGDSLGSIADFGASYHGEVLGVNGVTSLRLGYEWNKPLAFSPNATQLGMSAYSEGNDPTRSAADMSLTLSFTHDITPSFSLGGFAAATRTDEEGQQPANDLRFGAGLGLKF